MLLVPFSWLMSVLGHQENTVLDVASTLAFPWVSHSTHLVTCILLTNHFRFRQPQQSHPVVSLNHSEEL